MRYSSVSMAVLALASSVFGQYFDSILTPTRDEVLQAGNPYDITWAPEEVDGTIKITLMQGKSNITLDLGPVIGSGIENSVGKYTWVPADNGFATYGFLIQHETETALSQYSQPFHIKGGEGASTITIKLSTGPSYTSTSTSSIPSSTLSVSATTENLTTSSIALPTSNLTFLTTLTTPRSTAVPTTSGPASASSSAVTVTNAGVANVANYLTVIGGLVFAFAL